MWPFSKIKQFIWRKSSECINARIKEGEFDSILNIIVMAKVEDAIKASGDSLKNTISESNVILIRNIMEIRKKLKMKDVNPFREKKNA